MKTKTRHDRNLKKVSYNWVISSKFQLFKKLNFKISGQEEHLARYARVKFRVNSCVQMHTDVYPS